MYSIGGTHERKTKKQIKFIKEIDKEKTITRQTLLTNGIQKKMMPNMHGTWP